MEKPEALDRGLTRTVEEMRHDLVALYTQKSKTIEKIKEFSKLERQTK